MARRDWLKIFSVEDSQPPLDPPEAVGNLRILLEETQGNGASWAPVLMPQAYSDWVEASAAMLELARTYLPRVSSPSERLVLRQDDKTCVVVFRGFSQDYHVRISICERMEAPPAVPSSDPYGEPH